jgi:hypothetical protein
MLSLFASLPTPVALAITLCGCGLLLWACFALVRSPRTVFKVILSILGIAVPIAACYFLISSLSDMPTDDLLHLALVSLAGAFVAIIVVCPTICVWILVLRRKPRLISE